MRASTESQKFIALLSNIAAEENLPETVGEHSRELFAEMRRLVGDDGTSSSKLLDHIEYGLVEHEFPWGKEQTYGLKVKGTNTLLSDAMHSFENIITDELPESFKSYYPELSHEQWQAVIRMVINVITALDRRVLTQESANQQRHAPDAYPFQPTES
jgi:hypothetical protein